MSVDGSNPAARNFSTLVPVDQSAHIGVVWMWIASLIMRSGEFLGGPVQRLLPT